MFVSSDRSAASLAMVVMSKELPSPAMSKELPSPAATVLKGRKGRAVFTKADQVAANSSDEDWDSLDDDSEDEDGRVSNVGRGRVRLHAVQQQISKAALFKSRTPRHARRPSSCPPTRQTRQVRWEVAKAVRGVEGQRQGRCGA